MYLLFLFLLFHNMIEQRLQLRVFVYNNFYASKQNIKQNSMW